MLMTAAAMIVGMLPMAIGGAGEEQNARPGARRDRRPVVCNANNPAGRALSLRRAAKGQRRQDRAWRIRGGHRVNEDRFVGQRPKPAAEPFPRRLCQRTVRASRAVGRRGCSDSARFSLLLAGLPSAPGVTRCNITRPWSTAERRGQFRARGPRGNGQGERRHHGHFLARLHLCVYRGEHLRPCERLYRQAQRRHR